MNRWPGFYLIGASARQYDRIFCDEFQLYRGSYNTSEGEMKMKSVPRRVVGRQASPVSKPTPARVRTQEDVLRDFRVQAAGVCQRRRTSSDADAFLIEFLLTTLDQQGFDTSTLRDSLRLYPLSNVAEQEITRLREKEAAAQELVGELRQDIDELRQKTPPDSVLKVLRHLRQAFLEWSEPT